MSTPLPDLIEEARRIAATASEKEVALRLVGGVAVRLTSPSAAKPPLARGYRDVDLVGRASETRDIKSLFALLGYVPRETFNAMQGGRRLIFNDLSNSRRVDIFLDYFEMCHKFDLRKRLELRAQTLPLADLLETKLQIVEMSEKDMRDILALLLDHDFKDEDGGDYINSSHLTKLCSDDWGIYKTFTSSLEKVIGNLDKYPLEGEDRQVVERRAQTLLEAIQSVPKTLRWRLRAKVGEKVAWYENPEDDVAVVDSRF